MTSLNVNSEDDEQFYQANFTQLNNERTRLIDNNTSKRTHENNAYKNCPTCKGTGRIKQNEQNKLIALIPLSDSRLKPKRLWIWILITFLLCFIASFGIYFFLSPRSIDIKSIYQNVKPYNITYIRDTNSTTVGLIIDFNEKYSITNKNFYSVHMKNVTLQLNRNSRVTLPKLSYRKNVEIGARQNQTINVKVKYILYTLNDPYVQLCINEVLNDLFTLVSTYFSFSTLWNNDERYFIDSMQYIYCSNTSVQNPFINSA